MSSVTPGRATDALVAEKLGWKSIHFERHGDHENAYGQPTPTSHDCTPVPHYSTVDADAISALEATGRRYVVAKHEADYYCSILLDGPPQEIVDFDARSVEYQQPVVSGRAPTLCLAACAAILQLPTPHPPEPA